MASLFSQRIAIKPLVELCQRLSMAIGVGIDVRTVFAREAERASGPLRDQLSAISEAANRGESLTEAFAAAGDYFPALCCEMIRVGEQTGHVDSVLAQLADHYKNLLTLRRSFLVSITWPLVQLGLALLIVGGMIGIMGFLRFDILGFGLVGGRGLAIYAIFLACVGAALWLLIRSVGRGLVWTHSLQRFVLRLPGIGKPLQTLALARLAQTLQITTSSGMDIQRTLSLSLRSTQNAFYIDQIPIIEAEIASGNSSHGSFCRAGGYPADFLDTLAVGEQSGNLDDAMGRLAGEYQERARAALAILSMFAGWLVWAVVAVSIIMLIFRLFSFYLGALQDAVR
jgi:type II secretory pathway component PulF